MGAKPSSFKKKLLATSISSCLMASAGMAIAQAPTTDGSPTVVEEVQVFGIRQSLERAMDIKRDSSGVVDAISAEDIGKMPDTNLAESLQRITGVSIDRASGEGSLVSVRGIGPDYNMITLNGRTMPGAVNDPDGGPNSRAFDFANIASESVSGIEVYKTGKANIAGGGLGAAININTARPLDNPGLNLTVGAKAVHDTTNVSGRDVTPEVSGLFSWTDNNDTFGVAISASHQERDSSNVTAYVNDWQERHNYRQEGNTPTPEGLYHLPTDLRYAIEDRYRVRTNAQLTLQYRPIDRLTITTDYTYSENDIRNKLREQSIWFESGNVTNIEFDGSDVTQIPTTYTETFPAGSGADMSFAHQSSHTIALNKSAGINFSFDVNDDFNLTLDYHRSTAANRPANGEYSLANASVAAFVLSEQTVDWTQNIPVMTIAVDKGLEEGEPGFAQNNVLTAGDITTTRGRVHHAAQKTEIEQIKLDGLYHFDGFSLGFGVEHRSDSNVARYGSNDPIMGDWGGANPNRVPNSFFTPRDYPGELGIDGAFSGGFDWDFYDLTSWAANQAQIDNALWLMDEEYSREYTNFPMGRYTFGGEFNTNRLVEEDVNAAYVQVDLNLELGGMMVDVLAGVRYEETDLTSTSSVQVPTEIRWEGGNDLDIRRSPEFTDYARTFSYDNVLPSIDVSITPIDDVVVRASYSKTMARALYQELQADVSIGQGDLYQRRASGGNPELQPIESDNFDLSFEWYYGDASYASIGLFRKDVTNFIGQGSVTAEHFGLRDVRRGPRFEEARDQVIAAGGDASEEQRIWEQAMANAGLNINDPTHALVADETDPLMQWTTAAPVNDREDTIQGVELAVQHMFGETGFGLQANYTFVNSDLNFDDSLPNEGEDTQFVLVGLSDTANLVGFYDNHGFQARIAFNWRDKYIDGRNEGAHGNPRYVEAYHQIDVNTSFDLTDNLTIFAEGINITSESRRRHGRTEAMFWDYEKQGARYQVGFRYAL